MKPQRREKEFFDRKPETPVPLKRPDPAEKQRAFQYLDALNRVLAPLGVSAELFGSTDLGIATKGEWEYAVYLADEQWFTVLVRLINHYHGIYTLMEDFALFADTSEGTEIEVIAMRGEAAQRNQAIMAYWRGSPEAREEYEQGKLAHAYSRREYYRWKDEFIAGIVEKL